ncbi:uncharacterized protein ACR2FA_012772 [Aphomia sociella]
MAVTNRLCCSSIIFLCLIYSASSIYCYYCNSANNSACLNPDQYEEDVRSRIIPVVDCERAIPSPVTVNFFCRKIMQTIFHEHHDSELRVTRGCGWVRHHKECYQANNYDHLETVCQCFHDHCNSSEQVDPGAMTVLFLAFSAILYFYR